MNETAEYWEISWLDKNYTGAPNECNWHHLQGAIVYLNEDTGDCPKEGEHYTH